MARFRSHRILARHAHLADVAADWASAAPRGPLRAYGMRYGVAHCLAMRGPERARALLTDVAWLMARLDEIPEQGAAVVADVLATEDALARSGHVEFSAWATFFRERAHLLRRADVGLAKHGLRHRSYRGVQEWPTSRVLLQLAVEHADESPVTRAAERWLAQGSCDWIWLRRAGRPVRPERPPHLWVLEGHTSGVTGATLLPDGRVLSSSWDATLRLWNVSRGSAAGTLAEPEVTGNMTARVLPDGNVLSWSTDGTLRIWNAETGGLVRELNGHTRAVNGAMVLPGDRLLSWADDGTLRMWQGATGGGTRTLTGHTDRVHGALRVPEGMVLSWAGGFRCTDFTPLLWDEATGALLARLEGHRGTVDGACNLPGGRLLTWSSDQTLRVWEVDARSIRAHYSVQTVFPSHELTGHTGGVKGATVLESGIVLSWSHDGTLRTWNVDDGSARTVFEGHERIGILRQDATVRGAIELPDGRILSWSDDTTLRLWDTATGAALATLSGHGGPVGGALVTNAGHIVSWSDDHTLRLWSLRDGAPLGVLRGHSKQVGGALVLPTGRLISWSEDGTLRVWDMEAALAGPSDEVARVTGHSADVTHTLTLPGGHVVSCSEQDRTICVWDPATGTLLHALRGHTDAVLGILALPGERVLSWSKDATLRIWDAAHGAQIEVLTGHTGYVWGARLLQDGRILSWSLDGTLRLWDPQRGTPIAVLVGHMGGSTTSWSRAQGTRKEKVVLSLLLDTTGVQGATEFPDGRILSWGGDWSLRTWNPDGAGTYTVGWPMRLYVRLWLWVVGHTAPLMQEMDESVARRLEQSIAHMRTLITRSVPALRTLEGHTQPVKEARILDDGRILSWAHDVGWKTFMLPTHALERGEDTDMGVDRSIRMWDGATGVLLATMAGHTRAIHEAALLPDGRLYSRDYKGTRRLWRGDGTPLRVIPDEIDDVDACVGPADPRDPDAPAEMWGPVQWGIGVVETFAYNGIPWVADGQWKQDRASPDGTIIARCAHEVAVLHVVRGNQRISIAEADAWTRAS